MERPAPALIGSVIVHAAVVGAVVLAMMFGAQRPDRQIVNAVPVSILSEQMVLAGPADAPSPEPASDVEAAPPPEAVEPPPPTPAPTPTPRPPREESLDLGKLAAERPNTSPNRGDRPPSGQRATGTQGQTSGPVISSMFEQVYPNWNVFVVCDMEGGDDLRIQFDVTLSSDGRITEGPTLVGARGNSVYQAATAEALRALRATAPFDVPRGFTGGSYRPTFLTARACRGR